MSDASDPTFDAAATGADFDAGAVDTGDDPSSSRAATDIVTDHSTDADW